ncbi:MAG: hypothetical protein DCC43_11405 [Candidatus Brocadia sp.]|jgi:hypothetical protein|nr:hypothetical protein [Candidatus Brocadia sp. AMX3]OQZ01751.1 MAG: hypothetical protein B6D35_02205 [Candidatus Brocadia sp. UTAMX2]RIJ95758.1 MAG: hypothetical protein DCC43_11405 [Candidatus Brocadia sp.]
MVNLNLCGNFFSVRSARKAEKWPDIITICRLSDRHPDYDQITLDLSRRKVEWQVFNTTEMVCINPASACASEYSGYILFFQHLYPPLHRDREGREILDNEKYFMKSHP